jgi:hypothetical protein
VATLLAVIVMTLWEMMLSTSTPMFFSMLWAMKVS